MPLEKHFLHESSPFKDISKIRFWGGILTGLFFGVSLYLVINVSIGVISFSSFHTHFHERWSFSKEELNFYNFFFAFVALNFGQSICFRTWFHKKRKWRKRGYYQWQSIQIEQEFFNWTFLFWFIKMLLFYFIILTFSTTDNEIPNLSFYPDYNFMFILILITLFLYPWLSIRKKFKNKALKWMLVSALTLSALSFGLSKYSYVESLDLDLKKSVRETYTIELPKVDYEWAGHQYYGYEIDVFIAFKKGDTIPHVVFNDTLLSNETLEQDLRSALKRNRYIYRHRFIFRLYAHKEVSMEYIQRVKQIFKYVGCDHILYGIEPLQPHQKQDFYYGYSFRGINHTVVEVDSITLLKYYGSYPPPPPPLPEFLTLTIEELSEQYQIINLDLINKGEIRVGDTIIQSNQLLDYLYTNSHDSSSFVFNLIYDKEDSYNNYIVTHYSLQKYISKIRNDYSLQNFGIDLEYRSRDIMKEIYSKRPFRLREKYLN